jgi:NADH dehydrogenase FAD-containing subunit
MEAAAPRCALARRAVELRRCGGAAARRCTLRQRSLAPVAPRRAAFRQDVRSACAAVAPPPLPCSRPLRAAALGALLAASLALCGPAHARRAPPPPPPLTAAEAQRTAAEALALAVAALTTAGAVALMIARAYEPRPRVVIVGGGFAGLQAALELQAWAHVTVLDRTTAFEFTPGVLRALATGKLAPCLRPHAASLRRNATLLRVPAAAELHVRPGELRVAPVRAACSRMRLYPLALTRTATLRLQGVDTDAAGSVPTTLPYDYLILATGSSYPGVIKPDGTEQARRLAEPCAAANVQNASAHGLPSLSRADDEPSGAQSQADRATDVAAAAEALACARSVLILGGGVVGVELAAEIAHFHPALLVTVADVAPRLLSALPPAAGERAAEALTAAGVRLLLGAPLSRMQAAEPGGAASYAKPNGEAVSADVVYICSGARPNSGCIRGVALDARSYIRVDARWRVVDQPVANVYAIGDVASKPSAQALGSYAHWEAEYVAADIKRAWRHRRPTAYVAPPQLVNVSLGPQDGLFSYDGVPLFAGRPAAALKRLTQTWFMRLWPIPYVVLRWLPRVRGSEAASAALAVAPASA